MKFLILFALALATTAVVPISATKGRITNGKDADVGQFPYQVGLDFFEGSGKQQCGGSLIGNNYVLTTAHCTQYMDKVIVYLGSIKFGSSEVNYTVDSSEFIIHSGFDETTLANDIALIKIPSTDFTTNINIVELPPISSSYPTYEESDATASGWGRTSDSSPDMATYLQWGLMPVISNTKCADTYHSYITSSNICVASPGYVSICHGDSGGPLVLYTNNILIGVASFNNNYCEMGYPTAFTRVTSFLDWIKEKTGIYY